MSDIISRRGLLRGAAGLAATTAGVLRPGAAAAVEPPRRAGGPALRVGCCAYSYRDFLTGKRAPSMTLEGFLDRCAEMAIDGVELTSYYFPNEGVAACIRRLVRRAFLLGLDINGAAVGNSFAHPAGPERDRQIALVKQWVDYAGDLGAPCVRVFAGAAPKGVPDEQARGWVAECLETCCAYAGDRGVMLALENHGGTVSTPDGILAVMRAVQSEWLGMKLDTANFHTADPYADTARCAPYAITTHVKTEVFVGGRREQADLGRMVRLLKDAGYRGFMHLEYEAAEDPLVAVPRALSALRKLV